MNQLVVARGRLCAVALGCALGALPPAWSQPAPVLKHVEGSLALAPPGEREWLDARPGQPVRQGERLWIDRGSRAELQVAGHTLRAGGQTQLRIDQVQPRATRIGVLRGTAIARVGALAQGENFELGTPNLALRAAQNGLYRLDVDPAGTTHVSVLEGLARVYGQRGEEWEVRAGQRVSFRGRNLAVAAPPARPAADEIDRWVQAREQRGTSPSAAATQVAAAATVKPVAAAAAVPRPAAAAARPAARTPAASARTPAATGRAVASRPRTTAPPVRAAQAQGDAARAPARAETDHRWEQENWLRYNHGLPPLERPAPLAIPARRIG